MHLVKLNNAKIWAFVFHVTGCLLIYVMLSDLCSVIDCNGRGVVHRVPMLLFQQVFCWGFVIYQFENNSQRVFWGINIRC